MRVTTFKHRFGKAARKGFTLLELMTVIAVSGILLAIGAGSFNAWADAQAHAGTAADIEGVLRHTQQRAVTEGSSMCIQFTDDTWVLYRGKCESATRVRLRGTWETQSGEIHIEEAKFLNFAGNYVDGVTFSPRGTATPGEIIITRNGSDKERIVTVEGLTGRISENE